MFATLLFIVLSQGITENTILVGMESEAHSFSVNEENLGFRLAFEEANRSGGIHGRRIEIRALSRGDNDRVAQSVANAKKLAEEDGVFMLVNFGGPAAVAIGDYAMENDVPFLFPHTALLAVDGDRHVFTSFPRYDGESLAVLDYLVRERGASRIAVIHAPNVYGDYFRERVAELADRFGYVFTGSRALPLDPDNAREEMAALRANDPDTVVMALYPAGARRAVEAKAALGWDVRLVSSGPLTDEQYLNVEGGHAEGTIGLCHYPDPNRSDAPGVAAYRSLMESVHPGHPLNRYSLYGYVFGRLILEGLERAGPELTEDAFLDAMESIRGWGSGGIMPPVSFSTDNHHAQRAGYICELKDGHFEPLTGWIEPGE
jgi:ABC-type branched-subunit amino acid transport system substrate-binding protein